jgi:hypothetical protein
VGPCTSSLLPSFRKEKKIDKSGRNRRALPPNARWLIKGNGGSIVNSPLSNDRARKGSREVEEESREEWEECRDKTRIRSEGESRDELFISTPARHSHHSGAKFLHCRDPVPSPRPHLSAAQHTSLQFRSRFPNINSDLARLTSLFGLFFPLPLFLSPPARLSPLRPTVPPASTSTKAMLSTTLGVIQALPPSEADTATPTPPPIHVNQPVHCPLHIHRVSCCSTLTPSYA